MELYWDRPQETWLRLPQGELAMFTRRHDLNGLLNEVEAVKEAPKVCPACQEAITFVQTVACPSCEVSVLDMNDATVASRAKGLGVRSVPAVVIDGKLADCCTGDGPDEATLRTAGLGQAIA